MRERSNPQQQMRNAGMVECRPLKNDATRIAGGKVGQSKLRLGVLLAALLGLGWATRDAAWWTPIRQTLSGAQQELQSQVAVVAGPPAASSARKCLPAGGGAVVYTDGECPPGSRVLPASGGTVNVLPALDQGARPAASAASATPLLRQLAGPAGGADLQEKRLERAVNP